MITAWMSYSLLVGFSVAGAAWALDSFLRSQRKATRWVWAGALGLASLWPLIAILGPPPTSGGGIPSGGGVLALEPLALQVGTRSTWQLLETPFLLGWLGASSILGFLALLLLIRTRRLRREWIATEAQGRPVLLSEAWGPAVVGILHPRIVLPRWCQTLDPEGLELILRHEYEHLKAGDLPLLVLAGILPVLLPWSLPIWWMWHRLRLAVEGDCDLRVLEKDPGATRSYLELLLEVGRRPASGGIAAAMLSEPERTLERRITIMTMSIPRKPFLRGGILVGIGLVLVAVACLAPAPTALDDRPVDRVTDSVVEGGSFSQEPQFTPYTVRPDILNREEVALALEEHYTPELRKAGIGGTVTVWVFIDDAGVVRNVRVNEGSGEVALDQAALRVAESIEFTPALDGDVPVPVWISLPITFSTR